MGCGGILTPEVVRMLLSLITLLPLIAVISTPSSSSCSTSSSMVMIPSTTSTSTTPKPSLAYAFSLSLGTADCEIDARAATLPSGGPEQN